MNVSRRRGLVALALCGGGATVAAATWPRKPVDPPIATPLIGPTPATIRLRALDDADALMATDPPRPLPAFSFQDAAGGVHTMAEFKGRVVVLNLWATWCQPCVAELPALARLAKGGTEAGITVLPLSTDRGGVAAVRRFLSTNFIDLPIWVDPPGASGEALAVRGLPTTLLIDRTGFERGRVEGAIDWATDAAKTAILAATRTS